MEREIYASDGQYYLCPLSEEDREDYVELHRQINGENKLYLKHVCWDMMWEHALEGETRIYSIFDIQWQYCGSIEIQNPTSRTPEIGVDLLINFRNKGITPSAFRLLTKRFYDTNEVEYFIIRISSKNLHSKHVFEKLGAVQIGEEESTYNKILKSFRKIMGDEAMLKAEDSAKKILSETEDEWVYRYKYVP